jgi:LPS-assembly protein
MKNYYDEKKKITVNNIFSIDRLGLDDAFESGQSLTLGLNYRRENKEISSRYFDFELATVLRDKMNNKIPQSSTINNKYSNLFGSANFNFIDNFNLRYNFSLDNNLDSIEYSSVVANLKLGNFKTKIDFIEENSVIGSTNSIKNETRFDFHENNSLKFNTRRNRKINLTEYYDLIYEYKNDCLTAGLKYRKTYYEDRDLKPAEDLMFVITLFPLTSYEQKIDQNFYK